MWGAAENPTSGFSHEFDKAITTAVDQSKLTEKQEAPHSHSHSLHEEDADHLNLNFMSRLSLSSSSGLPLPPPVTLHLAAPLPRNCRSSSECSSASSSASSSGVSSYSSSSSCGSSCDCNCGWDDIASSSCSGGYLSEGENFTPLCPASQSAIQSALRNQLDDLKYYIDNGADLNAVDKLNRTALHYAFELKNDEVAVYLFDICAGICPIDCQICKAGLLKVTRLLMSRRAVETSLKATLKSRYAKLSNLSSHRRTRRRRKIGEGRGGEGGEGGEEIGVMSFEELLQETHEKLKDIGYENWAVGQTKKPTAVDDGGHSLLTNDEQQERVQSVDLLPISAPSSSCSSDSESDRPATPSPRTVLAAAAEAAEVQHREEEEEEASVDGKDFTLVYF